MWNNQIHLPPSNTSIIQSVSLPRHTRLPLYSRESKSLFARRLGFVVVFRIFPRNAAVLLESCHHTLLPLYFLFQCQTVEGNLDAKYILCMCVSVSSRLHTVPSSKGGRSSLMCIIYFIFYRQSYSNRRLSSKTGELRGKTKARSVHMLPVCT